MIKLIRERLRCKNCNYTFDDNWYDNSLVCPFCSEPDSIEVISDDSGNEPSDTTSSKTINRNRISSNKVSKRNATNYSDLKELDHFEGKTRNTISRTPDARKKNPIPNCLCWVIHSKNGCYYGPTTRGNHNWEKDINNSVVFVNRQVAQNKIDGGDLKGCNPEKVRIIDNEIVL